MTNLIGIEDCLTNNNEKLLVRRVEKFIFAIFAKFVK